MSSYKGKAKLREAFNKLLGFYRERQTIFRKEIFKGSLANYNFMRKFDIVREKRLDINNIEELLKVRINV